LQLLWIVTLAGGTSALGLVACTQCASDGKFLRKETRHSRV